MKLGIVGLPNVGKSTLFNAITNAGAESANYPFCTIEPNVGMVTVPDERLGTLAKIYSSKKILPAVVEFVDIAGLVEGASKGEGLGNKFLSHIRQVDAIVHVVRCFEDPNIIHVEGSVDPIRDIEIINLELIFSDIEMLERRIDKTKKGMKSDKNLANELVILEKLLEHLTDGKMAKVFPEYEENAELIDSIDLLSAKPIIFAANMDEMGFSSGTSERFEKVIEYAKNQKSEVLPICAKLEQEISDLEDDEKLMFLEEIGLNESGLDRLIKVCYHLLGLISYLTAGPEETRAWTITRGTKAPGAAGKIHTDFERGFIRAEIVSFDALVESGSMVSAKEKGLVRLEGKEYVVQDGDVILFRFNV
ncbi:MAG: redox-regulated ATPase YchF [Clostridia bacterium]